ncbi:hypothetical protein Bca52824_067969 [Brassica carinata]|uniref:inositol-phosphate phosphatase n=1 Tax=Brassica carinata TaxID=52824 RepID=A0A8X7QUF9_BRACI|nr:hypothetical protein Bca52824_067969 [Brassica carinata]
MAENGSLDQFLAAAVDAAQKAGQVIRKGFYETKHVEHKGQVDLVTETDKGCEELVFNHLKQLFPNHKFIGEETTAANGVTELTDEPTWIVDPLDGTTNFVHGFPFVCVSIGLTIGKVPVVGVVYNPIMDEMFTGVQGKGAFLNGKPIKVSTQSELVTALLLAEAGTKRDKATLDDATNRINSLLTKVRSLRMGGSCALDLCGVACGRGDIFYEIGFGGPWDIAAGIVIVREAGGLIFDPSGKELDITSQRIAASNASLKELFVEALRLTNIFFAALNYRRQVMDAQAKKKALFRSKLNAKKKETRIDSPLVRYNESDQPVCRVCNIVLKSESLWDVHQASRKHHEAIDNLKASAAGVQRSSKPAETKPTKLESSAAALSSKSQTSSGLPPNFFESSIKHPESAEVESSKPKNVHQGSETNKTKGPLPDGFFDNQKIDSSITKPPVILNRVRHRPRDEYKEFEKLIQEDLQVVDSRMEEEEVDAAETIEEEEQREQRSYKVKVEILKKRKMELKAARLAKRSKTSEGSVKKPKKTEEESPSDDEDDEDSAVDWRAQHV